MNRSRSPVRDLLIDPATGHPRWDAAQAKRGPKEDFAFETALRLQRGELNLDDLKSAIVEAANVEMEAAGRRGDLATLNDVKLAIGKSAKDWFFEIQRVAAQDAFLQRLVEQEGKGLTSLAREAGPIQAQRRKGYELETVGAAVRELVLLLEELRRDALVDSTINVRLIDECRKSVDTFRSLKTEFNDSARRGGSAAPERGERRVN